MSPDNRAAVAVIDYRLNNLASVCRALHEAGAARIDVLHRPEQLTRFSHLVLPGVGAFDVAMTHLDEAGWTDALRKHCGEMDVPLLGICLGMQLLAERSDEGPTVQGLGFIPGEVVRMTPDPGERVPHVGWNTVHPTSETTLFLGLHSDLDFYFVHSYEYIPTSPGMRTAHTPFGGGSITSAVQSRNVVGVQFHPEKSSLPGVVLLRNFLAWSGENA